MIIFPKAARAQSISPVTKDFQLPRGSSGARFTASYTAEDNAASTLDIKFQRWTGSAWTDLASSAETAIKFTQFTGVAEQELVVMGGAPDELTTAPTLSANLFLAGPLRAVATMAGGGGTDKITFSLIANPIWS
jgi:hypothetical protein